MLSLLVAAAAAFPPIPEGFYAYDSSCRASLAGVDGDNAPNNLVLFTRKWFIEPLPEGGPAVTGFQDLGGKRWKVLTRDHDGASSFVIKIVGPQMFETEDYRTSYSFCPNVPASVRKTWYE